MTEHTRVDFGADGVAGETAVTPGPTLLAQTQAAAAAPATATIECGACPVLCQIAPGRTGACDRYANDRGELVRVDPVLVFGRRPLGAGSGANAGSAAEVVPFGTAAPSAALADAQSFFVTGVGASSTYPDYKPAPFIVAAEVEGVDMVTVVTEGIFSYCSLKVKIDTDRYLGAECAAVRSQGEVVGHVTTAEYGSQMLSLGGVHHLTGGSKREGRITCELMRSLCNGAAAELAIDGGSHLVVQSGRPPSVDGQLETRMRVGCGSATIGMFARQWHGAVDEVIVVDDHITGVLSEHQAGRHLGMARSGIRVRGRKSTPGRYFQVARPGTGWGGTDITDPLSIIESIDGARARPGMRLLMVSTTGEHAAFFVLDAQLRPEPSAMPEPVRSVVERIAENCEAALCTILFVGGAGGSLRAGVTQNPVRLTEAIKAGRVNVTCAGAPTYIWPGGGITFMVDVARLPAASFGSVPTPALVAPLEFTLALDDYAALGGHLGEVRRLEEIVALGPWHRDGAPRALVCQAANPVNPWPWTAQALVG